LAWVGQRHGGLSEPAVGCVLGLHWIIDEFEPYMERANKLAAVPTSLKQVRGESGTGC
jgi:hypothetical protein